MVSAIVDCEIYKLYKLGIINVLIKSRVYESKKTNKVFLPGSLPIVKKLIHFFSNLNNPTVNAASVIRTPTGINNVVKILSMRYFMIIVFISSLFLRSS